MSGPRNRAVGEWVDCEVVTPRITIQYADMLDTRTNHVYREGARRVLVDGKPVKGKGGTHPFLGEMAWAAAERLADDLYWQQRHA